MQYLSDTGSNNLSFEQINILGGTLTSGQTLALNAIGTATTANLQYVFPNNFTVNAGATMNVAPNVSVILQPAYNTALTVTDNGTITFNSGDTVNFADAAYSPTVLLSVNSGGVLNASGTAFHAASTGNSTQLYVGAGGQLTASISTFALTSVNLTAGSTDTIQFSAFATQLAINSGASVTVNSDDFSSSMCDCGRLGRSQRHNQPGKQLLGHDRHRADCCQDYRPQQCSFRYVPLVLYGSVRLPLSGDNASAVAVMLAVAKILRRAVQGNQAPERRGGIVLSGPRSRVQSPWLLARPLVGILQDIVCKGVRTMRTRSPDRTRNCRPGN